MGDLAKANIIANIFPDSRKGSLSGILNYEPKDANDEWVTGKKSVSNSSGDLIGTSYDFFDTGQQTATTDIVEWIIIKNVSTTATDGVMINLEAGTAAWDGHGVVIGAGEAVMFKPAQGVSNGDIHAISITMSGANGRATGTHSGTVDVVFAAIFDD